MDKKTTLQKHNKSGNNLGASKASKTWLEKKTNNTQIAKTKSITTSSLCINFQPGKIILEVTLTKDPRDQPQLQVQLLR